MRQLTRSIRWIVLTCSLAGCTGHADRPAPQQSAVTQQPAAISQKTAAERYQPEHIDDERLHNAFRLHEKVISGGLPDEASMQALKERGVKTVIRVDGARPDVELAKKYGMRYVHLPHGYDGIPGQRARELARAVRDLQGPIFIHCHHGKHRSPAAAATACIAVGLVAPENGLSILKAAGTSENYRGLYQSVQEAHPLDKVLLDELNAEFKETVDVPPMAEAMVALEKTHDHLKTLSGNGWNPTVKNPDLDPAHEALLLREHFTEMLRTDEVQRQPDEFKKLLRDSEQAAKELETALLAFKHGGDAAKLPKEAPTSFELVTKNCKACHQKFRDIPLREKTAKR